MGKLIDPDTWAAKHGAKVGVRAWADDVPDEVREMVARSKASTRNLVTWFHTVVAEQYPGEEWPAKATHSKVDRLAREVRGG